MGEVWASWGKVCHCRGALKFQELKPSPVPLPLPMANKPKQNKDEDMITICSLSSKKARYINKQIWRLSIILDSRGADGKVKARQCGFSGIPIPQAPPK